MSKFEEKLEKYAAQIREKTDVELDEALLRKVTKGLGPSIYNADSGQVSCTDAKERETVRERFLKKKHGLTNSDEELDQAIEDVCKGYNARPKHRAVFYYMLTQNLDLAKNYDK